ncbi:MAG TPA: PIN domain-containing protein [Thermoanaerobaculia bacterium]|nr:PIN domain-containing protein [Thermoanaerobaculia bacterium]
MVLVDTSVWLSKNSVEALLDLATKEVLAICPPVVQELLQGAHDEARMKRMRTIVSNSEMLDSPMPLARFEFAGDIYRIAREKSFTIRSSNDCLIAAIAMHHDVLLLHGDHDFDYIAQLFPLRARNVIPSASAARS